MSHKTLLIKKPDIENVYKMSDALECVENAFRLYGEGKVQMPSKVYLIFEHGDLRCMPSYIPAYNIAGVKNVNVHPNNTDLPTVMATLTLIDTETGFPVAIMDATYITNIRTGASGGIAAKYLAREDASVAGFVGAGIQADTQLDALILAKPGLARAIAFDIDTSHSERFAEYARRCGVEAQIAGSIEEVVSNCDILCTTTPVRKPIVLDSFVKEGLHINAIGADAEGKQEMESAVLKRAKIVIDSWDQASHSGEINVPVAKGEITKDNIYGDIGEIVTGGKPGRTSENEITLFDSTGLGIQDLACAAKVYEIFKSDKELLDTLSSIDFF
jgi:alanine dehydrogenase